MIFSFGRPSVCSRFFHNSLLISTFLILIHLDVPANASYLHANGSKLYNDKGDAVRLTGVNWFGFETSNLGPHGLWARDYHGILLQIKSLGFNCIRMPFCDAMFADSAKVSSINFFGVDSFYPRDKDCMNKELKGLSPIQMMDEIVKYAGQLGLVIILDNHSRDPDGYMNEKVWYSKDISEQQWIDNWVNLAARYKNNPTIIGCDLDNEPHGKPSEGGSSWGTGNLSTDWNTAAQKCGNAILAVNPDVLIFVEGVEKFESTGYWWGGNLRGVKTNPIKLSKPEKLVYSAHEYGPEVFQQTWFDDPSFPSNLKDVWDNAFGFVVKNNVAPLFIGEFGIKDMKSYDGKSGTWFTIFLKYLADNMCSWTFWCFNPNSGDTGGMLSYDWISVEQWKADALKPWCAPLINEPIKVISSLVHKPQNASYLIFNNNRISCRDGVKGKLQIVNLNGKVLKSTTQMPLSINVSEPGVFLSILTQDSRVVEKMLVKVY